MQFACQIILYLLALHTPLIQNPTNFLSEVREERASQPASQVIPKDTVSMHFAQGGSIL
jgi:hypothetical protein